MTDVAPGLAALKRFEAFLDDIAEEYPGPLTDCVYYWLRGDLIKIGQSRCLSRRLKNLQPGELLAIEPGMRNIEQGRHQQFRDYHEPCSWGTEWFRPGPLLVWHIEAMAKLYPTELLDELPQFRVPMAQLQDPSAVVRQHDADAKRRLALWVDMLPQIVAQDVDNLATPTPGGPR